MTDADDGAKSPEQVVSEAVKESSATATEAVVGAVAQLAEVIAPAVAPNVAPAHAPSPGPASVAVRDIATIVRAGADAPPAATKAAAGVVADITSAGRKNTINVLWEATQAFLAIALTTATIVAAFSHSKPEIPSTLTNALFVVLGFYFGRTNHTRPTPMMSTDDAPPPTATSS